MKKTIDIENTGNTLAVSDSEFDVRLNDGLFLNSLHYMTPNDIELNDEAKNVKKPRPDYLKYAVLLICACVFFYSGYTIVQTIISYIEAYHANQELRNIFANIEVSPTDLSKPQMTRTARPLQDLLSSQRQTETQTVEAEYSERVSEIVQNSVYLDDLRVINPDTKGWIRVLCPYDTRIENIRYPIVQAPDNDYYLDHDFFGNTQRVGQSPGAIYFDFRNDPNVDGNLNTIIYGHNMGDTSMFGTLLYFGGDINKFNAGIIEIYTWNAIYRYQIFSVYETYADSRGYNFSYITTDFRSEYEYVEFLQELKAKSKFQKDVRLTSKSKIITLSTCTNNWRDTRFAVHGVLVEVIRD